MKAKATHNGKGFTGHIETELIYERVKNGEMDWKEHVKPNITHYTIPASVFQRLLELDKANTAQ